VFPKENDHLKQLEQSFHNFCLVLFDLHSNLN
jgi:hypothetical protein